MIGESDARKNRAFWDDFSDEYQARHGPELMGRALGWGGYGLPEAELRLLGDVVGKDVLELGCGAAQRSIALAQLGARPVGLDNSARQLEHARRLMAEAAVDFPLVHAPAQRVPLPDASFDIVFCDHGAMRYADPRETLPEVARLLRPAGVLAFSTYTPLWMMCRDDEADRIDTCLHTSYFDLYRLDDRESVQFSPTYSEWIRLFHAYGFVVEALIEPPPPEGYETTFQRPKEWVERWPVEQIWKVRKSAGPSIRILANQVHAMCRAHGWYDTDSPYAQTPRNIAVSVAMEAAEVLEHFQWGDDYDRDALAGELADVAMYLFQLADLVDVDLAQAIEDKIAVNMTRRWGE